VSSSPSPQALAQLLGEVRSQQLAGLVAGNASDDDHGGRVMAAGAWGDAAAWSIRSKVRFASLPGKAG
jgi:hypothetical protein